MAFADDGGEGKRKPSKQAVLGIDIGGTSIKWAVYERIGDKLAETPIKYLSGGIKTKPEGAAFPELKQHVQDVVELVENAIYEAENKKYTIVSVGVASPGKFINDGRGGKKIERGSSPNMGAEFDEVNLQAAFHDGLKAKQISLPLAVINDAAAQQMGIIDAMLRKEGKSQLLDKTVGYIGLGTGLGGGFAEVDKKGKVTPITDGHLSDVMIPLSANGKAIATETNRILNELIPDIQARGGMVTPNDQPFTLSADGERIKGDDILSGKAIYRFTGVSPRHFKDNEGSLNIYRERLMTIPHSIAQLIHQVKNKDIAKQHEFQSWPDADKDAASKTSVWLLSGGIMENNVLGPFIMEQTEKKLKALGINDITLVRNEVEQAAERAAAAAAPVPEKARSAAVA